MPARAQAYYEIELTTSAAEFARFELHLAPENMVYRSVMLAGKIDGQDWAEAAEMAAGILPDARYREKTRVQPAIAVFMVTRGAEVEVRRDVCARIINPLSEALAHPSAMLSAIRDAREFLLA